MFYMSSQAFLGGNLILELVVPQAAQDISSKFMSCKNVKFFFKKKIQGFIRVENRSICA